MRQEKGKSKRGFLGSEGFRFQAVVSCLRPEGLHVGTWGNGGLWGWGAEIMLMKKYCQMPKVVCAAGK